MENHFIFDESHANPYCTKYKFWAPYKRWDTHKPNNGAKFALRIIQVDVTWCAMRHTRLCHGRRPCTTRNLPLLTPFYNMECKIIRKIGQNRTWIVAAIPCVNVTPNRHNAIAQAIVYVSNDVTIPFNSMTSQLTHNGSAPGWNLNMF